MLNQFFIGGALIVTTVFVHAVILEVIIKALIAVRTDIEVRWRAVAFALVILAVFIAHVIEIWIWAALYYFKASISEIPTLEAAVYFSTSSFTTSPIPCVDQHVRLLCLARNCSPFMRWVARP